MYKTQQDAAIKGYRILYIVASHSCPSRTRRTMSLTACRDVKPTVCVYMCTRDFPLIAQIQAMWLSQGTTHLHVNPDECQ
jgi:hypothetical protein